MAEPVLSDEMPAAVIPLRVLSDAGEIITAEMSVEQWFSLLDHPRQRNTERHARADHWKFAKRAQGAALRHLAHVTAACWNGSFYKVNGHTRAYLWAKGELPCPVRLHVTIHKVATREELNELYAAFDAQWAAKPEFEKVYGGLRECGLELKSRRLKRGFLVDAFNIALRGLTRPHQDKRRSEPVDVYKAVATFQEELKLLDTVNPPSEVFYAGVIAAALIALSLFPSSLEFWRKLALREGNKQNGLIDTVEIVLSQVDKLRRGRSSWENAQQELLCGRTLAAFLAWEKARQGKGQSWFRTTVHAVDLQPYIAQLKAEKGIADDPYL